MLNTAYDLKSENKIASGWLLNYHERLQAFKSSMASFSELGATIYTGMPNSSSVGNPTENKGITLAQLEETKVWLMTIEDTERCLSEKKRTYLDIRRRSAEIEVQQEIGRPGWVDYVQVRYAEWHRRRYGGEYLPSRRQMFRWWNEIVDIAVRIAIRRGVL